MSDAQTRWENKRADDCADAGQPQCPKFPDHDCGECHESHKEEGEFSNFCLYCSNEICPKCLGKGSVKIIIAEDTETIECDDCDGAGRIDV